jgi:hypothetical protein
MGASNLEKATVCRPGESLPAGLFWRESRMLSRREVLLAAVALTAACARRRVAPSQRTGSSPHLATVTLAISGMT